MAKTMVSSEKMQVVRVHTEGSERSDSLYIYGVDTPAVMEVLGNAFGNGEGAKQATRKPRQVRGKGKKNAGKDEA